MRANATAAPTEKDIILIVDGDTTRRFMTAIFLQRTGYTVFPVHTAEECLMIMELIRPQLVITDIVLPRMSGIDLVKNIRRDAASRETPVLAYTTLQDPSLRGECEQAGCTGYLQQSPDHNLLYEAVQKATTESAETPRSVVRLATSLDVIVEGAAQREGVSSRDKVTALSEHGMYVRTPAPLAVGTVLPFTLFLDRDLAWGIRVAGKILYSHPAGHADTLPGMGVKFTEIRREDQEAIRHFIGKMLFKGIATPVKRSS